MSGRAERLAAVRPRRGLVFLVGLAGALLFALALPAAGSRLAGLKGRAALERLADRGELTQDGYRRLLLAGDRARSWLAEPQRQKELALALHAMAQRESGSAAALLVEAREALLAGLEEAPADPIGWLRLAQLDAAQFDLARAAAALRVSQRIGRVAPEIAVARAALALGLWEWLAEPVREHARVELARSFLVDPATLAGIARATGTVGLVRSSLAGDPAASSALERELERAARAAVVDGGAG